MKDQLVLHSSVEPTPEFLEQLALIDDVFRLAKEQSLNDSSAAVAA
jgi:hypothetical protein